MALDLPDGPRKLAFNAVLQWLQADPLLNRIVRSWLVWDGSDKNPSLSTEMMPAVGLRLVGNTIERLATIDDSGTEDGTGIPTVDVRTRPTLVVETWVAGSDAGDSYDLGDYLDTVLFPADQEARQAIREVFWEVGLTDWQPTKDILPESERDYTSTSIHAKGTYQLTLDLTQ